MGTASGFAAPWGPCAPKTAAPSPDVLPHPQMCCPGIVAPLSTSRGTRGHWGLSLAIQHSDLVKLVSPPFIPASGAQRRLQQSGSVSKSRLLCSYDLCLLTPKY